MGLFSIRLHGFFHLIPLALVAAPLMAAANTNVFVPIDLRPALDKAENADWQDRKHSFAAIPRGLTNLGNIDFRCDGVIQLLSARFQTENKNFRRTVRVPLPTNQFSAIHLLGGLSSAANGGITAGEVVVTYATGKPERFPIKVNVHMKDWWRMGHEEPPLVSDSSGRVVWRGLHAQSQAQNKTLRIYCVTFENPRPAEKVTKLELVSAMMQPGLFVCGLTLDLRAQHDRPAAPVDLDLDELPLSRKLAIRVLDAATGAPIPSATLVSKGVELIKTTNSVHRSAYEKSVVTDEKGVAALPYSQLPLDKLTIDCAAANYSPWVAGWEPSKGEKIPNETTIRLQPGAVLGGTVVDEQGLAVAGAGIRVSRIYRGGEPIERGNNRLSFTSATNLTDHAGRWTVTSVPETLFESLSVRVTHPDYADSSELPNAGAITKLRAMNHVTTLTRGFEITGYVTDTNRAPVEGARVVFDRRYSGVGREATSDASGAYRITKARLPSLPPGAASQSSNEVTVTAFSDKHAPSMQKIKLTEEVTRLDFTLAPGNVIRGRVVDSDGNAIVGASISRSSSPFQRDDAAEWRGKTDSSGNFEWSGAPAGPQQFSFFASGFASSEQSLEPGDTVHTITLRPASTLSGQVIDAETQQPITHFFALPGQSYGNPARLSGYASSDEKEFKDDEGKFEVALRRDRDNAVQIRAKGYMTETKASSRTNTEPLLIALRRTSTFQGRVIDPSGSPLSAVGVAAGGAGPGSSISIDRSGISRITRVDRTATDANGEFSLEPTAEVAFLIAASPTHFGQISAEEFLQTKTIVVQPHGHITGVLRIGRNPGADRPITLQMDRVSVSGVMFQIPEFRVNTDAEGRFSFQGVPAGQLAIAQLKMTGPSSWQHLRSTPVEVKPGQTTEVTIGGDGATLKGHLQWPATAAEGNRSFKDLYQNCTLMDLDPASILRDPRNNAIVPRYIHFQIGDNGAFEAVDIPPGKYDLMIELRELSPGQRYPSLAGKPVGSYQTEIEIADANQAIDFGALELTDKPLVRRRLIAP